MTLIFSSALDKDMNSQAARGNETVAYPWCIAFEELINS
jgi:hypothetical protein